MPVAPLASTVEPIPDIVPPVQDNVPDTVSAPAPSSVPLDSVSDAVLEATVALVSSSDPAIVSVPTLDSDPTWLAPEVTLTVTALAMQARSLVPGTAPVDQLPALVHRLSCAPPVQVTVQVGSADVAAEEIINTAVVARTSSSSSRPRACRPDNGKTPIGLSRE